MRVFSILFIGLTILLSGCETTTSTSSGDTSDKTTKSNNSVVEGVWLVSEEIIDSIHYNFSHKDTDKLLTNYLIVLNNNGMGFYHTYGIDLQSQTPKVDTTIQTQSFNYAVNGSYLMIDSKAYQFSTDNETLILEDNQSIKHLTPYTGAIPLKEWKKNNIYSYGFEKASINDVIGEWSVGVNQLVFMKSGILLYISENGSGNGTWEFVDGYISYTMDLGNSIEITIQGICRTTKDNSLLQIDNKIWFKL